MGIVNDHTGAKVVRVVRLPVPNTSKKFAIQGFCQADITNVVLCNMGVYAWLHIAIRIDVKVPPAPGNASLHVGTVVPEVENKERFFSSESQYLPPQIVSLLWRYHQINVPLAIDRKVEKIHLSDHALVDKHVDELIRSDRLNIMPCDCRRGP